MSGAEQETAPALVIDLDGTLTIEGSAPRYEDVLPRLEVIAQVRNYAAQGFRIIIMTSRNMRSFNNSLGRINAQTLPIAIEWLKRHGVPFDEIHVGKPWCGPGGFYVDDKAVRPSEFRALDPAAIATLLAREKQGVSVGIITSAAFVNPEMSAEFGLLPPAFLPVGNARLFQHQAALLARLADRIVLTLPQSFFLPPHDAQLLAELGVTVIRLPDGLTLAQSVMSAIIQSIEGDEPVVILHGDTLFPGLEGFAFDRVSVHEKDHPYPWAVVTNAMPLAVAPSLEGDGGGLVSGLFSFSHSLAFLKCLAAPGTDFLSALNAYGRQFSEFRAEPDAGQWLDFGHLNTYCDSRRALTTQRAFNTLSITHNVVHKTSTQTDKMDAEASWFERLPGELRPYVPAYVGRDGQGATTTGYRLAYEYLCPLSELFVFGALPPVTWRRILAACADVLTLFRAQPAPAPMAGLFDQLYGGKAQSRFRQFAVAAGIDPARSWTVNGRAMPSPAELIREMAARIGPPNAGDSTVMHGDFCLSNILFDFRRGGVKLLDPRGYVACGKPSLYGDTRYDLAKLHHSIAGGYDFIVAGRCTLVRANAYELDLSVAEAAGQADIETLYRDIICGGERLEVMAASSVLLFLSMLPLHADDPERQWALFANAYRLYQRFFRDAA